MNVIVKEEGLLALLFLTTIDIFESIIADTTFLNTNFKCQCQFKIVLTFLNDYAN